jgi:site-specific DNA-methyltransferase (adenine-specific)
MKLINADCIAAMKEMDDNSVDSIVTDPPYELGFMGKSWDASGIAFNVDVWREALRVLKPGGHLIAFSGSRTYHRMAVAIEDAGFEIRDQIMWVYGSGFPKSLNISKAIQKANGVEPIGFKENKDAIFYGSGDYNSTPRQLFMPPLEGEAAQWNGWGTALKPAHEPMVLARKPVIGTVANNVLTFGVGGLNIDASRVPSDDGFEKAWDKPVSTNISADGGKYISEGAKHTVDLGDYKPSGRFPANFIHDGSDEVLDLLGEPARFFYCAKASKRDRNEGLDGFEIKQTVGGGGLTEAGGAYGSIKAPAQNHHPTVKPTSLMQYLVRLVTPPNGTVLDPFMGSGSTGKACAYEGFDFIGIEQSSEYVEIAQARIEYARGDKK